MQSTIIENLSGRKLSILVMLFFVAQIVCFLIGGLIAPTPASSQNHLATTCENNHPNGSEPNGGSWFYFRGKGGCRPVEMNYYYLDNRPQAHQVVYIFQVFG